MAEAFVVGSGGVSFGRPVRSVYLIVLFSWMMVSRIWRSGINVRMNGL